MKVLDIICSIKGLCLILQTILLAQLKYFHCYERYAFLNLTVHYQMYVLKDCGNGDYLVKMLHTFYQQELNQVILVKNVFFLYNLLPDILDNFLFLLKYMGLLSNFNSVNLWAIIVFHLNITGKFYPNHLLVICTPKNYSMKLIKQHLIQEQLLLS